MNRVSTRGSAKLEVSYKEPNSELDDHFSTNSNDDNFLGLDDEINEAESDFGTLYQFIVNFNHFQYFEFHSKSTFIILNS